MSFIVSYNGQFKPYILPDLTHYDKVKHVYKSDQLHSLKTEDKAPEFQNVLNSKNGQHKPVHQKAASEYKKQNHQFKKESIPHHARDLMSKNLKTLNEMQFVSEAIELMQKFNFRHIPVINDKRVLVGMISDRDLLNINGNIKLSDRMSKEVLTCLESTRIQDIAKIMLHEKISAIPIIDDNHQLAGIITQTDILSFVTKVLSINVLF